MRIGRWLCCSLCCPILRCVCRCSRRFGFIFPVLPLYTSSPFLATDLCLYSSCTHAYHAFSFSFSVHPLLCSLPCSYHHRISPATLAVRHSIDAHTFERSWPVYSYRYTYIPHFTLLFFFRVLSVQFTSYFQRPGRRHSPALMTFVFAFRIFARRVRTSRSYHR